jgi:hypothetical protein
MGRKVTTYGTYGDNLWDVRSLSMGRTGDQLWERGDNLWDVRSQRPVDNFSTGESRPVFGPFSGAWVGCDRQICQPQPDRLIALP